MTSQFDDNDHIPEDDDPAYDNPVGKLPPKSEDRKPSRVRQPFDFEECVMHSEGDRLQMEQEWAESVMPELRTREMNNPLAWLESLRKSRDKADAALNKTKEGSEAEATLWAACDMYDDLICIWTTELALFMKDLRKDMADYAESKYAKAGSNATLIAERLRENSKP